MYDLGIRTGMEGTGKMRNLTPQEIEILLQKYQGARKIAVENFLSTVSACAIKYYALQNLQKDRMAYGWNIDTYLAIREGINIANNRDIR